MRPSAAPVTPLAEDGPARLRLSVLLPVAALVAVGVIAITSASFDPRSEDLLAFGKKQMIWAALGAIAFALARLLPYERVAQRADVFYVLCIGMLLALFVIGTEVNGARRWFALGPIRITPSEFMKLGLVLILARHLRFAGERLKTPAGVVVPCLLTLVPLLLVVKQPDLGTSLTFIPALFVMLYVAGTDRRILATGIGAGAAIVPIAWFFVLHGYQKRRVLAFLNPEEHALGVAYQSIQSVIAVGSGGLTGADPGAPTMGRMGFVPARHTDFILTVVAEEGGFIATVAVLLLFTWLLIALLEVAATTREPYGRLVAAGLATILGMQVIVNTAMTLGAAPVTGLPLPFLSYGGSSLILWCAATGYVHGIATRRLRTFGSRDGPPVRVI